MNISEEEFESNVDHYLSIAEGEHIFITRRDGTMGMLGPTSEKGILKLSCVSE